MSREPNEVCEALLYGHVESMYNVGTMFDRGEGCEQNYAAAADWYRQAAAGGNSCAMVNLGNLLTQHRMRGGTD